MKLRTATFALLCIPGLLLGCVYDPNYRPDFGFPVDYGDVEMGKQAFVDLGCNFCHNVRGIDLPTHPIASYVHFELGSSAGGTTTAELVTAIINPDHYISERYRDQRLLQSSVPLESPMPLMDEMTVRQLYDLVAFLDSQYY